MAVSLPFAGCALDLLHLVNFRLRFQRETRLHFFHHTAMYATILDRLGNPPDFPPGVAFYTPERGRAVYHSGDLYNFGVAIHPHGPISPADLVGLVSRSPATKFGNTSGAPFGNNYRIEAIVDAVTGLPPGDRPPAALSLFDVEQAVSELANMESVEIRFLSPFFIRRTADTGRTLMDGTCFYPDKFLENLWRGLHDWWPGASFLDGLEMPAGLEVIENRLLRTDVTYPNPKNNRNPKRLEGVSGRIVIGFPGGVGRWAVPLMLGGIVGVSRPSNRRMGQGRYAIVGFPVPAAAWPPTPAATILERAATLDNFTNVRLAMCQAGRAPGVDGVEFDEFLDRLTVYTPKLTSRLRTGRVEPSPLRGLLIQERKEDGGEKLRPLAIPTIEDRFLQRVVMTELAPAIAQLWEDVSHAYRPGLSHLTAREAVARARDEGFVHVLDADVRSFFDEVDWDLLRIRLEAYFGDDPVVDSLMAWACAPVEFSGTLFRRSKGLPQGAVVSPMLANLYLDALDETITEKGYRLVRYADDFVILCKKPEQASQAVEIVRDELERLNLVLNDEKTAETSFEAGFKFLGALFCKSMAIETDKGGGRVIGVTDRLPPGSDAKTLEPRAWLKDFLAATGGAADACDAVEGLQDRGGVRWGPAVFPPMPLRKPVYVITGQARLSGCKRGLVIDKEGEKSRMVPWNELSEIVVLGGRWISGSVVQRAMVNRIPIAFHKWDGTPLGLVLPDKVRSPSPAAMAQWEWMKRDGVALSAASQLVAAKIRNTRMTARRRREDVTKLMQDLASAIRDAVAADSIEKLMGVEGRAAHAYFSQWQTWTRAELGEFPGRYARGAEDPVNVMLNLLYTQLFRLTHTTILSTGLDPYMGVMHDGKGRYAALAADMMEPFRFVVDRVVLNAVNHRLLGPADFIRSEKGPYKVRLSHAGMTRLIQDFEALMSTSVADKADRQATFREHLYRQVMSLRQVVEGVDGARFQPFELKW